MKAYAFELLEGIFPPWEIDPSNSERLEMRTDLPFTLERSLEAGKGEQLLDPSYHQSSLDYGYAT
ncbi:MAG: hypothetical protein M3461_04770 [Pseudomonadota bacterium]|nr:hypothetical protein [Pseudomonadota bacterium]